MDDEEDVSVIETSDDDDQDIETQLAALEEGGDEEVVASEEEPPQSKANEKPAKAPLPPEEVEKRWRQTQAALKETREQRARDRATYEENMKALIAKIGAPAAAKAEQQVEQEIDPEADPLGALKALMTKAKGYEQTIEQERQQREQETRQRQNEQAFWSTVAGAEAQYRAQQPDYDEALNFWAEGKVEEFMSYGLDEDDAKLAVKREYMQGAVAALQRNLSPAQAIYNAARARGYQPKQQNTQAQERVRQVKDGQQNARSMPAGGGGAAKGDLKPADIAKLSGAAFDAAFEKLISG